MKKRGDKTAGNQNLAIANNLQQLQTGDAAMQFADERADAIAQGNIQDAANQSTQATQLQSYQEMADNSTTVKQLMSYQAMADKNVAETVQRKENKTGLPHQLKSGVEQLSGMDYSVNNNLVTQRVVDWGAVRKTEGEEYAISADHSTLYSKDDADVPEPASMYTRGTDATNDVEPVPLKTWKPNVKFLTGAAIDHGHVPTPEERAGWADRSIERPTDEHILGELRPEYERIKAEVTEAMRAEPAEGGASPTMGIVGRNDCAQWATALQGLIYRTRGAMEDAEKQGFNLGKEAEPNMEDAPAVGVGDKMEQKLGAGAGSGHHGATVVATDGGSRVTLEAHVEKELSAPEFHIHEGLSGFVDSNNAGVEGANQYLEANGREGSVTPLGAVRQSAADRVTMLAHYSQELASDDHSTKLGGIQGLLRYYEEVVPEVEAEIEAEAEVPVPEAPRRRRGFCFLTTACVTFRNLPDDCEELTVLRDFRDNYMSKLSQGNSLIEKYYEVAPGIVAAIDRSPNRRDIYEELYWILRRCVDAIKLGDNDFALQVYKEMVIKLHQTYL